MVHNGIEYGIMAAYAEGMNILHHANIGSKMTEQDAETAPIENAQEYYSYDFDMPQVAEVWRRGSVIASWLLDLTAEALYKSPQLDEFSGRVSDSGEGRWTVLAAIDEGRAGERAQRLAVRPLRLPRRGRLRRQAAVGDAQAVRRPRREARRLTASVTGSARAVWTCTGSGWSDSACSSTIWLHRLSGV